MDNYCRICRKITVQTNGTEDRDIEHYETYGVVHITNVPFEMCLVCGTKVYDGKALALLSYAIANGIYECDFSTELPVQAKDPVVKPVIVNV